MKTNEDGIPAESNDVESNSGESDVSQPDKSTNTVWHIEQTVRDDRERMQKHRSLLLWFTGLSGSGKSTVAQAVEKKLHDMGRHTYTLDGDNIRHGLCSDLGFSDADRQENIRRIGEVGKLMVDAGVVVMAAFISPFKTDRMRVRNLLPPGDFVEILCDCPLEICEQRDVKGLYRKARMGVIPEFTGISSPFEVSANPEIRLKTGEKDIETCVDEVIAFIDARIRNGLGG